MYNALECLTSPSHDRRTRNSLEVGLEALRVLGTELTADTCIERGVCGQEEREVRRVGSAARAPPGPRMTIGQLKLPPEV